MDINDLRSIITVVTFAMFVGIVVWAYSGRRRQAFDEAANMPFEEEMSDDPQLSRNNERKA